MLKRYVVASLVAGLAFAAQSAVADTLWFYEGHGWLPQPPYSMESRQGMMIAGGKDTPYPEYATKSERPPFEVPDSGRLVTVFVSGSTSFIAGPTSAAAGTVSSEAMTLKGGASSQIAAPAPYNRSGFDAGYFN